MTAGRGLTCPDATLADPLHPPYHNRWVLAFLIFFFFFLRNVKVVPNTRGSANTIEEASQYFLEGRGERKERKRARTTTQNSLGPRAEASVGTRVGPGEGGSGTPLRVPHTAWHARPAPIAVTWLTCHVHHAVCTAPLKPRRTLTAAPPPPERKKPSPSPQCGEHSPAARHIL